MSSKQIINDQDLFNYIMFYEEEDIDCLDYNERAYLQGDYDEEIYGDLDVLQAIEQRQRHELKLMAEDDPQVCDYLRQCEEEEQRGS